MILLRNISRKSNAKNLPKCLEQKVQVKVHSKSLKQFIKFLKQKEMEKENRVEDDLGFEINFEAFQPEKKVSFRAQYFLRSRLLFRFIFSKNCTILMKQLYFQFPVRKPLIEKTNYGAKKESEKRKKSIPKDFITKIKNLGMKVEDAELLFKSKINWCAVYSENKIYCVEPGCNYFTTIDNEELKNHMIQLRSL